MRSQILISGNLTSVEEVYARVKAEEQRHHIIIEKKNKRHGNKRSALINRGNIFRPSIHCKKSGHTINFCLNLHTERRIYEEETLVTC